MPNGALLEAAVLHLVRHNRLWNFAADGWVYDKVPDPEAGHEAILTVLLPAINGPNLIPGIRVIQSGMAFDVKQLVLETRSSKCLDCGSPLCDFGERSCLN